MAFFASYAFYWCMMLVVARRVSGFSLSAANIRHTLIILVAIGLTSVSQGFLPKVAAAAIGAILTLLLSYYGLKRIVSVLGPDTIRAWVDKLKSRFGMRKSAV